MSDDLEDYLKSVNPNPLHHPELKFGKQYRLYRDDEFIVIATWTEDENIGSHFQTMEVGEHGLNKVVHLPTRWEGID